MSVKKSTLLYFPLRENSPAVRLNAVMFRQMEIRIFDISGIESATSGPDLEPGAEQPRSKSTWYVQFSSVKSRLKDSVKMNLCQGLRVCVSVQVYLSVHWKFLYPTRLQHHLLAHRQQLLHDLSDVFSLTVDECVLPVVFSDSHADRGLWPAETLSSWSSAWWTSMHCTSTHTHTQTINTQTNQQRVRRTQRANDRSGDLWPLSIQGSLHRQWVFMVIGEPPNGKQQPSRSPRRTSSYSLIHKLHPPIKTYFLRKSKGTLHRKRTRKIR